MKLCALIMDLRKTFTFDATNSRQQSLLCHQTLFGLSRNFLFETGPGLGNIRRFNGSR
jgi:hypothetical protein